jgi:trimethylamine--corrinoid protein Co-methyltransferase
MRYEAISREDCAKIHGAALQVLEKTGAKFESKEIRDLLAKAGCTVDEKTHIVKFPPELVEESLKKCPSEFTISGRDPKKAVKVSYDGKSRYANFGTAVKYGTFDENGKWNVRECREEDVGTAIKIVDSLPNFDMGVTPCSAVNLVGTGVSKDTHEQYQAIMNMTKHMMADWVAINLRYGFEFEKAVLGDEDDAMKHPFYTIGAPPASPLVFDAERFANNVVEATKYNMPVMAMGMVLNGATGPVYCAGSLVVACAESLATIVVAQQLRPGCNVWYGSSGTIMDLKAGGAAVGAPERALLSAACSDMAHYYRIPSFIAGSESDSKVIDVQDGHEKTLTGVLSVLSNASMHFGPGMLENGLTFSPDQLLIDDDIISMMKVAGDGIEVNDETLSVDDINAVGPGGNFLPLPATMANIDRQSSPAIFDRGVVGDWLEQKHGMDAAHVAHERVQEIIRDYEPEPIDKDIVKQLQAIVKKADKEVGQAQNA